MNLTEILKEREERFLIQKEMNKRWNSALVSFSLNIPGKNKNSKKFQPLYKIGAQELAHSPFEILDSKTTAQAVINCFKTSPEDLKNHFQNFEDNHPLGRFFDFDILDHKHTKLSRSSPRKCFVCHSNAKICGRNRQHAPETLLKHVSHQTKHYFCKLYSQLALESLIEEVDCTPKPGLVDKNNNGSHQDMNHALFIKSAHSLKHYFYECTERGFSFKGKNPSTFFKSLRPLGIQAEKTMFETTGGVNTHKGAIFTLGLHCAALGYFIAQGKALTPNSLLAFHQLVRQMCSSTLLKELKKSTNKTAGEKAYKAFGIGGIRQEAAHGYPFVYFKALSYYQNQQKETDKDTATIKAFLYLLKNTDDTNVIKRGGLESLTLVKQMAKRTLEQQPFNIQSVIEMDNFFISKNLSPGGAADLLALLLFLSKCLKTESHSIFLRKDLLIDSLFSRS